MAKDDPTSTGPDRTGSQPSKPKRDKPRRIGAGPAVRAPMPAVPVPDAAGGGDTVHPNAKPEGAPDKGKKGRKPAPAKAPAPPPGEMPPRQGPPRPPEMRGLPATAPRPTPPKAPEIMTAPDAAAARERPPVAPAGAQRRHWMVVLSFLMFVVIPAAVVAWYLWERAADQYASTVGFSVRKEEVGSAVELLGGVAELSGSSSSDTDILYEFLQSQTLVADIDKAIDLRTMWSKPQNDPFYALKEGGAIEDLLVYWDGMVKITYDSGAGLIEVRALAFDPEDATAIAQALFDRSSQMINNLSAIAREDAIRYAREELETGVERLKIAREAVTRFRNINQLVDPTQDTQVQAGLLGTLQAQLAEALIDLDIMRDTTRANDPRLTQAQRRVEVIENRIAAERQKMGLGGGEEAGEVFANLVSEYERLVVDREFAERSYTSALAAYDASQAEARRKSRYLAAHVQPTKAESSRFPERTLLLMLTTLFLFLVWSIATLMAYALRDRR